MAKHVFNGKVYGTTDPASTSEAGLVKVDGIQLDVDENGILKLVGEFAKLRVNAKAVYDNEFTADWEAGEYYVVTNHGTIHDGNVYKCITAAIKEFEIYNDEYTEDQLIKVAGIGTVDANDYPYGTLLEDTEDGNRIYDVTVHSGNEAVIVEVTDNVVLTDIEISSDLYDGQFALKNAKNIHFWIS